MATDLRNHAIAFLLTIVLEVAVALLLGLSLAMNAAS
jgi:hypothetical protein